MTSKQKVGLVVMIIGLLAGGVGALWNLYSGYAALQSAELGGLGPVSNSFRAALLFILAGVIGAAIGAALIIFGRSKPSDRHTGSDL